MKLSEVQTRDKVPAGGPGNFTNRLEASRGWLLECDYAKRVVFASLASLRLIVPFENAPYMRPFVEPEVKPEVKPAKAAKPATAA